MGNKSNSLSWFEIPAVDVARSKNFYETIFGVSMEDNEMGDNKMAFFPWEDGSGKATREVVQSPSHKPSMEGTVVYLNANPSMDPILGKIEGAGGKVTMPKMSIGEHGHIAFFMDTEGSNVGLHSTE